MTDEKVQAAMTDLESKIGAFTEAHRGETAEEILAAMSGEEPVSEDLEKEFNRFLDDVEGMPRLWHSDEQKEWGKDIARHFANWQKQQMMREAVEKEVYADEYGCPYVHVDAGLKWFDRVKVIIIKTSD